MRIAVLALLLSGCGSTVPPPEPWPEAAGLFHSDPRWLGSDVASSIPLGGDRTLWLFGDTFVATSAANVRSESEMVRNSIGVQQGLDPTSASMQFRWSVDPDGSPASFFAEDGERWMWPTHGARIGDRVLVFLAAQRSTGSDGVFNFEHAGNRVAILENVDAGIEAWTVRAIDLPALSFDAAIACGVVVTADHMVGIATRNAGTHVGYLVRWPLASVAMDDFSQPELFDGGAWTTIVDGAPDEMLADAGAECSLHYDAARAQYIHVYSRGFGSSTIAFHTADRLEGPWSASIDLHRPSEAEQENVFVYAAKAHPELEAGGGLAVTYATNSFDFWSLFTSTELYYPQLVRVDLPGR